MSSNIVKILREKSFFRIIGILLFLSPFNLLGQAQLPFTMTEAALNDASICTVTGTDDYSWDGGVVLSNDGVFSGGWNWDDKTLRIAVTGYPDSIYFSASHSGAATDPVWYLKESSDGLNPKTLAETTKGQDYAVKLSPSTKYVYIVYSGNLAGYIKNLRITPIYKLKVVSEGVVLREEFVRAGTPIEVNEQPTKDCYTFSGWDKTVPATMPAGDLTLTAVFDAIQYTSNFKVSNDELGVTLADYSKSFDCGSAVSVESPSQIGYTFEGWNPEIPTIADASMEGVTYTAQWTQNEYVLKLILTEDSVVEKKFHYGDAINLETPLREGYTFREWNNDVPATMPANDITLKAFWDINRYKLTLNKGLDFIPQSETRELEYQAVISVNSLEHEGYTFLGWEPELPTTMPASDFVSDAQWKANQYRHVIYTTETDSVETLVDYGTDLTPLEDAVREGYTFLGWDVEQPATMPATDVIIKAQWKINQYNLDLMVSDTVYKRYSFTYGDSVLVDSENPEKEGYTFAGWDDEFPEIMPAEDLSYNSLWTVNQYRYVVYTSETDSTEEILDFGTALDSLPNLEKEGYTFVGWSVEQPATMPAYDLVLRPVWQINQYTLNLMVDGEVFKSYTFDYNATIVLGEGAIPTKEGYTFDGWDAEIAENMPASDLSYEAQWVLNQYRHVVYITETDSIVSIYDFGTPLEPLGNELRVGYTFKGWDVEQPATMPAYNLTIKAIWEINQYKIDFVVDGVAFLSYTFDYNADVDLKDYVDPSKEGYTFAGWGAEIPITMPAKDLEYEAAWTLNEYTIVWVNNPDNAMMNDTLTYKYGESIQLVADPEREGYTFKGWDVEIPESMPAKNLVINSLWKINVYNLNFYSEGELYLKQIYEYGATIDYSSLANPIRSGYFFLGWDSNKPVTMPAMDVDLNARWSLNAHALVWVTDENDPATNDTIFYEYGSAIEPIADPSKEGYTFLGWDVKIPEVMPDNSLIITAKWSINSYTLTTLVNCVPTTYTYTYGDEVVIADPQVEGYQFNGWSPAVPAIMPGNNVLVIADMQLLQYNFITTVDEVSDTIKYNYSEAIVAPEEPTKEGYTFKGWSADIPATMPAKDVELIALWEANSYQIHFIADEDTLQSVTYVYGSKIALPKQPTKTGYLFVDWLDNMGGNIPATMPAEDLTFFAEWRVNSYYFVTIADGDTISKKYDYNEEIATPQTPIRKGYTFTEWNKTIPATMPANNDTVKALWSINSYVLTWIVDGDSSQVVYDYGEAITKVKDPEKSGYTFVGWDQFIAETMPDKDLFYTAEFEVNSYQFIVNVDGVKDSTQYAFGEEVVLPEEPTKKGHSFVTWLGTIPTIMPAHDVEIYAWFERDTFELKIKAEEDTIIYQYPYDSKIQTIIAPPIAGKVFDKWSEELPEKMPAEDLIIEALYKANQYQLTIIKGTETDIEYYDYEEEIDEPKEPTKEGYTFAGWNVEYPTVMPDSNVVVVAQWEINKYDLIVVVDEDTTQTSYQFNEEVEQPKNPTKEGYTFLGWSAPIPAIMPAKDVMVEAEFVVDTFIMTTIVENVRTEVAYPFGASVKAPKKPSREGYTFKGWSVEIPETMPAKNVVTEAEWKVNQYELFLVVDGDTTSVEYDYNALVEVPSQPEKVGHTFVGWNPTIPALMPAEDVIVEAEFVTDEFLFTTIAEGVVNTEKYHYGDEVTKPASPTREGYTFKGWSAEVPKTMPDSNVTLVAEWKVNSYNLSFVVDGDTIETAKYKFGAKVEVIDVEDKEGYTFVGWDEIVPVTMPANDLVFNAVWEVNTYNFIYEVSGDVTIENYAYGDSIDIPAAPTKEGHKFVGWDKEIPATMPSEDIVISALWEVMNFNITLTIEGKTYTCPVKYGEHLSLETPVKVGYVFVGWSAEVPEEMPAENISFEAEFKPIGKLITWTEHCKLFVTGLDEDVEISVYDLFGRLLYVGLQGEIDLPTGSYVVQAQDEYRKVIVK